MAEYNKGKQNSTRALMQYDHFEIKVSSRQILKILSDCGVDINAINVYGDTPPT